MGDDQTNLLLENLHSDLFPEQNPSPVLRVNSEGILLYANRAAAGLLLHWQAVVGGGVPDIVRHEIAMALADGANRELEFCYAERDLSFILVPIAAHGYVNLYGRDVTGYKQVERALRNNEAWLRLFIDNAPAGLAMFDRDMRYLCASRRWNQDYGLGDCDLTGLSHYEVFPEIGDAWKEAHRRGLAGEVVRAEADRFERANGSIQWVRWEIRPWHDTAGDVGGIVIFAEDITDLKRAEARRDLLAEAASQLLISEAPQEVVDSLCRKVMAFLDCHAFFNFLLDGPHGRLRLNACAGIPEEDRAKIEWLDFGVAVCGCAARDACRIVAEDIPNTPDPRTELVKSYGIRAYACHPLMAQGRVLGTLSFGTRTRDRFTGEDLALMKAVADHVAIAMERKRTESIVHTRLRLSELARHGSTEELVQTALDEAEHLTFSTTGFFHFVDDDQKTLTLQTWSATTRMTCPTVGKGGQLPMDRAGVWADYIQGGAPVVHNNGANPSPGKAWPAWPMPVMRELVVPVVRGGAVVAIAGLGNKRSDYLPSDVNILQEFASLAMDLVATKRAEEGRDASNRFLCLVNASTATRNLIEAATGFFQTISGCEAVGVRLRDGDDYPYFEVRGFPREFVQAENSLCARDAAGEIVRDHTGNPVLDCMCGNIIYGRFDPTREYFTPNGSFWTNATTELLAATSEADRLARTRNRCNGEGYESVALIPLRLGEERLGLLQLNDRRKGMFTLYGIELWEKLADYLAVALAKFRAEDALRRQAEELHVSNQELIRFNSATVGRELRMIELKKEVNALCSQLGQPPRYPLDFEAG